MNTPPRGLLVTVLILIWILYSGVTNLRSGNTVMGIFMVAVVVICPLIYVYPELFIGFAKNIKVGSLMNVCFIISTKTKSTLFPHLKKGKVPL